MYRAGERRAVSGVRRRRSRAPPGRSRRRPGAGDQVDDLGLQAVRVLELVHHDPPEAERVADRLVAEQVAREELQVLEVERRLALLGCGVLGGEAAEQLLQQLAVARGELLERGALDRAARLFVARGALALGAHTA